MSGERLPGGSADETESSLGGSDADVVPFLAQDPQESAGLVGGNPSRDPEKNVRGQVRSSSTTTSKDTSSMAAGS